MSEAYKIGSKEELAGVMQQLIEHRVSDIFITANRPISIRKVGEVLHTTTLAPDEDTLTAFLNAYGDVQIKGKLSDMDVHPEGSIDGAISTEGQRYRYNFFRALDADTMRQTVKVSFRPLSNKIPTPDELLLPPRLVQTMDDLKQGLVLVCGKTGHGKSTSLASLIQHRANKFKEHIITLEQPIEYSLSSPRSIISQREVGVSVISFAYGLRAALRQNPDTILVGEIRDRETAEIALSASESGHIVFGTLHTANAAQSIERFVNLFSSEQQPSAWNVLSTALKAIVCQILVRDTEGNRVAAREILLVNNSIASYIKNKDLNGVRRAIESGYNEYGMVNWNKAAELLSRQGLIGEQERKQIIALGD